MAQKSVALIAAFKPWLIVEDHNVDLAIAFYKSAFGVVETRNPQELPLIEIELAGSTFVVSSYLLSSEKTKGTTVILRLETGDVAAAVAKSIAAGAIQVPELTVADIAGGVEGKVIDPFGFTWVFTSPVKKTTENTVNKEMAETRGHVQNKDELLALIVTHVVGIEVKSFKNDYPRLMEDLDALCASGQIMILSPEVTGSEDGIAFAKNEYDIYDKVPQILNDLFFSTKIPSYRELASELKGARMKPTERTLELAAKERVAEGMEPAGKKKKKMTPLDITNKDELLTMILRAIPYGLKVAELNRENLYVLAAQCGFGGLIRV